MKSLIHTDLSVAAKFSNTCRCIDDLLTLNNPDFQACIGQIYPQKLELKKTIQRAMTAVPTWILTLVS